MINVLSVDVEDYFHVQAFAAHIPCASWDSFTPRVEQNIHRVLELFDEHHVRGTFFVLGWVAERFPILVRRIAQAGHEIGCHGFAHQRLHDQTPQQFREDVRTARGRITNEAQRPVIAYRAPSFSIVQDTLWAFDILAEEGFTLDSSVFPVRHDIYGIPDARRFPHWHSTSTERLIFEFPPSTIRIGKNNCGVGGGGYLRFAPYHLTRWALRRINEKERQPAMVYFHPWEIDPDQPRIAAGLRSRVRHYTNLSRMEEKLRCLLSDFQFGPLSEVCGELPAFKSQKVEEQKV
jgi:polysaccharide deacetylase family protein (PEP-CTERM system associated)